MLSPRTEAGAAALTALLAAPDRALLALDYDGTLAPIVPDPLQAVPEPGAVEVLADLASRFGLVALITGRPADLVVELGGLARVAGLVVLGQYGVERWQGGVTERLPPPPGLDEARRRLAELELPLGAQVEDKGLTLSVHTRQADEPLLAMARLHSTVSEVAAAAGLSVHLGRMVLELRPVGHDKGRALRSLAMGAPRSAVLFAGDDLGDLAAFEEVEGVRRTGGLGLLVCSDSAEAPRQLRERADLVVPGPPGVVALLRELCQALGS